MDIIILYPKEIDNSIINYLELFDLQYLVLCNKKIYNIINQQNKSYIEFKNFFQNFNKILENLPSHIFQYISKNLKFHKKQIFVQNFLIACLLKNKNIIIYLNKKYNLEKYFIRGFLLVLINNDINYSKWFYNFLNLSQILIPSQILVPIFTRLNMENILFVEKKIIDFDNICRNISYDQSIEYDNVNLIQYFNSKYLLDLSWLFEIACQNSKIELVKYLLPSMSKSKINSIIPKLNIFNIKIIKLLINFLENNIIIDEPLNLLEDIPNLQNKYPIFNDNNKIIICIEQTLQKGNPEYLKYFCSRLQIDTGFLKYYFSISDNSEVRNFIIEQYGIGKICGSNHIHEFNSHCNILELKFLDYIIKLGALDDKLSCLYSYTDYFINLESPFILEFSINYKSEYLEQIKYNIARLKELNENNIKKNILKPQVLNWLLDKKLIQFSDIKNYLEAQINYLLEIIINSKNYSSYDIIKTCLIKITNLAIDNNFIMNWYKYLYKYFAISKKLSKLIINKFFVVLPSKIIEPKYTLKDIKYNNIKIWIGN